MLYVLKKLKFYITCELNFFIILVYFLPTQQHIIIENQKILFNFENFFNFCNFCICSYALTKIIRFLTNTRIYSNNK